MEREQEPITKLKQEFLDLPKGDNIALIKFYEKNKELIESIDILKSDENYYTKLKLICEYGLGLVNNGHYRKGVEILGQAVPMFENTPNQEYDKLKDISYFENLLWDYGFALHETKQTNKAIEVFKRLNAYYPENDKYRNWFYGLKAIKLGKIVKPIWILGGIWLIGELTLFEKFESRTRFYLSMIGGVILLIILSFEITIYLIKRKKSTNTQHVV